MEAYSVIHCQSGWTVETFSSQELAQTFIKKHPTGYDMAIQKVIIKNTIEA